ncbi:Gfo/Idh/MocA family oxidoreductase [Cohnella pontilimi]|uniref:Gfo/Idh/MocA family oxidoreductase n=1 Tax=Cohnella pontilimi TaxID=2564100 RepID=A0A4U0FGI2_9BACL|nr:Gfo/Idh/MocA family oxidoreductase [Cohnella pontilimi]TJY44116.1 Gfo/Idh/MocA family oxidoreductase [Cohnella pontilimi]
MKRYAIVGAGSRALSMFARPLVSELKDCAELAGIYDINRHRAEAMSTQCGGIPAFDDFDRMLEAVKPEVVIVASIDSTHHAYIIRALEAGCDVITEKPMTIDAEKCRAILDAERKTGKKVVVTFNMRFVPYVAQIKRLLDENVIGDILSIQLDWSLDQSHGADYFRRWHRKLDNSGGLLVHKSTHHFDMVNWWLNDEPEEVFAFGARKFYGPTRDERGIRCLNCRYQASCEFYFDITANAFTDTYYLQAEHHDGYMRDGCVFSEDIDIYDTMSVNVRYSGGALFTYSLAAYSPYEGWKAVLIGTEGRLEAEEYFSGVHSGETVQEIRLYDGKGGLQTIPVNSAEGDHGGSDEKLRRAIFAGDDSDSLGQQAGSWAGAMSLLIGAAANLSIDTKKPVTIKELLSP